MFARINSAEPPADALDGLIAFSEEHLPAAQAAPGFTGFYLLADRKSGKVVSISLWQSAEDLERFEAQGARMREDATAELRIAPTPVDLYEVVLQA